MRAIWALTVACLLAVTGASPAHAAERSRVELPGPADAIASIDRQPALPAVAAARSSSLVVAVRSAAALHLPHAVLAAPPALVRPVRCELAAAPHLAQGPGSASVPTRSARGPPAR